MGYGPWGCKGSDTTEQLHSLHSLPGATNATGLAGTLGGPTCRAWKAVCGFFPFKIPVLNKNI